MVLIQILVTVNIVILVCWLWVQLKLGKGNSSSEAQNEGLKGFLAEQQRMEERLQQSHYQLMGVLGENNERVLERYGQFERVIGEQLLQHGQLLSDQLEKRLTQIDNRVSERLDQSFEKANETFQSILVRLAKIDEAQRKIESLSGDIVSLQNLLSDKKSRGTFGEVQLYQIIAAVFGEKNDRVYRMQYQLSNGTIVDGMLFAPQPLGNLPIDSKFPLENYQRMMDRSLDEGMREMAKRQFKVDIKKHIDDIFNKYIAAEETSDQAVMFLPAEAIFAEINAYHPDLVAYSQAKRVWLVSPTTFMSTLTTIQVILNNLERDRHALVIQKELNKLGEEFKRYKGRWDKLSKHIETVSKDVKDIHITTEKIGSRFESISKVELDIVEEN